MDIDVIKAADRQFAESPNRLKNRRECESCGKTRMLIESGFSGLAVCRECNRGEYMYNAR